MRYSLLADIYEQLESTSGKLEKTDIISKLLKQTKPEFLEKVVLLLFGRVFFAWSQKELGVANQLMIKAISKSSGNSQKKIIEKFKELGDLGLVAKHFAGIKVQKILFKKELFVQKVFENIEKIAQQSGPRSQDRKLNLIAELLALADPKESKYIVRTVLEELRVGVAEGILRDAIAKAFNISPELVESAWSLNPDYGQIAEIAKSKGTTGLKKVKIELGRPMIMLLAEKAPDLKTAVESYKNCILEWKYDGMRCQCHKKGNHVWLYTRRLENVTEQFPDLVKLCKNINARECIIEGETLAIDKKTGNPVPFQRLSQRIHRKYEIEQMTKEIPIQVNLFDIVYLNGKLLFDLPLKTRRAVLEKNITQAPGKFQLSHALITKDLKKAEQFYKQALQAGQEGLMVKNLDAKYVPGRKVAGGWLKVKPIMETLDLAIVGAIWGTGKRTGWLGSFILACRDPDTGEFLECGMLGTGVKEKVTKPEDVTFEQMTELLKEYIEFEKDNTVKIKPKILIEVAYEEIQKSPTYDSGFALRFPRFIKIRWERSIWDVDTIERVKHLYNIQKGKK